MILDFSLAGLKHYGFIGFVTVELLWQQGYEMLPNEPGVYVIYRESCNQPDFLPASVGGWFKGKDPTVPVEVLKENWVDGAQVLYFGKAGGGKTRRTLRSRIKEYLQFGQGKPVAHRGGRYIWQLRGFEKLLVGSKVLPDDDPRTVEKELINAFKMAYGKKPYANLRS